MSGPPIQFDWTVNVSTLIGQGSLLIALVYAIAKVSLIFREYPPHRHVRIDGRELIQYPRGMRPEANDLTPGAKAST